MDFNSRPSARGDAPVFGDSCVFFQFQFTPLREGRHESCTGQHSVHHFNSRPSTRGDLFPQHPYNVLFRFQFTPLREGRHDTRVGIPTCNTISIHAPPRGATIDFRVTHKGRARISIHAPPRGATRSIGGEKNANKFQFTPLREGRLAGRWLQRHPPEHFNSRPSARGDAAAAASSACHSISIHAPPRGATQPPAEAPAASQISIHAPPRGATWAALWTTSQT